MTRLFFTFTLLLSFATSSFAASRVTVQGTIKQFSAVDHYMDMKSTVDTAKNKCETADLGMEHICVRNDDICLGASRDCYQRMVVFDAIVTFHARESAYHRAKRAALTNCFEASAINCKAVRTK